MVTVQNFVVIPDKFYIELIQILSKDKMIVVMMIMVTTCNIDTIANIRNLAWPERELMTTLQQSSMQAHKLNGISLLDYIYYVI
jgi:hypothetical protein